MNDVTVIVNFLIYAALAGLLGAVAMTVVMKLIGRTDPRCGGMVTGLGSLLTRSRENALLVGVFVHAISAVFFGIVYTLLMMALQLTAWPQAFFAGAGFGLFHGLVVSLTLVWIVADHHPLEEFRKATPLVFLSHFAGHVAFGATVGLVVAFAPV